LDVKGNFFFKTQEKRGVSYISLKRPSLEMPNCRLSSTSSSDRDPKDPYHIFAAEKIHPSACGVQESYAFETVALDLHRQSNLRQRTILWPDIGKIIKLIVHLTDCTPELANPCILSLNIYVERVGLNLRMRI
jgi:hypothetical protein